MQQQGVGDKQQQGMGIGDRAAAEVERRMDGSGIKQQQQK